MKKNGRQTSFFLAMGFLGPEKANVIQGLGIDLDERGNVKTDKNYATSVDGVFCRW